MRRRELFTRLLAVKKAYKKKAVKKRQIISQLSDLQLTIKASLNSGNHSESY